MAINQQATSFATPNFSGMLFVKGNESTPFSTMIGANPLQTNHVEFATGQEFAAEVGSQPEISENASLTAPTPKTVIREQKTNVTQIFHEALGVSYAKESNMGTLSGLNAAGQQANPNSELAFQVTRRMAKIAQDIEFTFINGQFNKATSDAQANKTRGLLSAITTNVLDVDDEPLTYWLVAEALKSIHEQGGTTNNIVLGVDATTMLQLNYDAGKNGYTKVPSSRNVNGLNLMTVITPLGEVAVALIDALPNGTAMLFNPMIMHPVYQPVPGKGNFFLEELAKTGASKPYQIFGQAGLDHGPEWMSAKITNISALMPSQIASGGSPTLGTLSVSSVAGTTYGNTNISVTPAKLATNSYVYKVGNSAETVTYGASLSSWTAWDGSSDITAENGKTITVAEVNTSKKAVKAGSVVVVANTTV